MFVSLFLAGLYVGQFAQDLDFRGQLTVTGKILYYDGDNYTQLMITTKTGDTWNYLKYILMTTAPKTGINLQIIHINAWSGSSSTEQPKYNKVIFGRQNVKYVVSYKNSTHITTNTSITKTMLMNIFNGGIWYRPAIYANFALLFRYKYSNDITTHKILQPQIVDIKLNDTNSKPSTFVRVSCHTDRRSVDVSSIKKYINPSALIYVFFKESSVIYNLMDIDWSKHYMKGWFSIHMKDDVCLDQLILSSSAGSMNGMLDLYYKRKFIWRALVNSSIYTFDFKQRQSDVISYKSYNDSISFHITMRIDCVFKDVVVVYNVSQFDYRKSYAIKLRTEINYYNLLPLSLDQANIIFHVCHPISGICSVGLSIMVSPIWTEIGIIQDFDIQLIDVWHDDKYTYRLLILDLPGIAD